MAIKKPTSQLLEILFRSNPAQAVLKTSRRDRGLADSIRFPFLALVGQPEMKLALIMALINPAMGGVLLIGPRGTGKTTAVRGLGDILPQVQRSTCSNGCEPEAAHALGIDAVCPECATKLGQGEPITSLDRMRLVELPLNIRLEDVVGGVNERIALEQNKVRLERGVLSMADQNLLYIDEVNLLDDVIIDAILDAAAQGYYSVLRGPMAGTYRSRLMLIGSMNPEEGSLRPQIQDRFGLRVLVRGLPDATQRAEVYRRMSAYRRNPHALVAEWLAGTQIVAEEVAGARERLNDVTLPARVEKTGLKWIRKLGIDSHRAEATLFEAARARAAADERLKTAVADLRAVAPMVLRQRRSSYIDDFFKRQGKEDVEIARVIANARAPNSKPKTRKKKVKKTTKRKKS